MVHRSNLALIDADHPPEKIVEAVLESAYTRLPLWRGDPDNIIGVLHAKALLRAVQANGGKVEGVDIVALALPPWFVPDTTTLLAQLRAFRARREHFALVVDEYGRCAASSPSGHSSRRSSAISRTSMTSRSPASRPSPTAAISSTAR